MGSMIIQPPWGHGAVSGKYTNVYGSYAVEVPPKGGWMSLDHMWAYQGRICGMGESRAKEGHQYPTEGTGCFCHYLKLTERDNKENFYFTLNPGDQQRMGCVPHSGEHIDYSTVYKVLKALAGLALGLINIYASFAWAAADIFIDELISAIDTEVLESEYLKIRFDYPKLGYNFPTDCGCWYKWEIYVNPEQAIKFDGHEFFAGAEIDWDVYFVEHSFTGTIWSPPPVDEMSEAERREYGIEEIPVSKIKERAVELGISSKMVKEHLELDEPLYITNRGVEIVRHPTRVFRTDIDSYESEFDRRATRRNE